MQHLAALRIAFAAEHAGAVQQVDITRLQPQRLAGALLPFKRRQAKDVVDAVSAREGEFRAGAFHPFTGPLRSNDGKVVHASGPMSDDELWKMDYYVEGVVGKVPAGGK